MPLSSTARRKSPRSKAANSPGRRLVSSAGVFPLRGVGGRYGLIFACLVFYILALGCSSKPAFKIQGKARDIARIAGTWEGTYQSEITRRAGTIQFLVETAKDSARGLVVMMPRGWGKEIARTDSQAWHDRPDLLHKLHFRTMRISGRKVKGTLEPYRDPDCGCDLETSFEGALDGDTITGTFTSREIDTDSLFVVIDQQNGSSYTGRWHVQRSH